MLKIKDTHHHDVIVLAHPNINIIHTSMGKVCKNSKVSSCNVVVKGNAYSDCLRV